MSRQISFLVINEPIKRSSDSNIEVDGRCYEGPIRIGDHFRRIQGQESPQQFDLVVVDILSYGKHLSEIDAVFTGKLILSGHLEQPMTDHEVIVGEAQDD